MARASDSKAVTGSPTSTSYLLSKKIGCKQVAQTISRRGHGAGDPPAESGRKTSRAYGFTKSPARDYASAYSGNSHPSLAAVEPSHVPIQLQGQANIIDGSPRMSMQQQPHVATRGWGLCGSFAVSTHHHE